MAEKYLSITVLNKQVVIDGSHKFTTKRAKNTIYLKGVLVKMRSSFAQVEEMRKAFLLLFVLLMSVSFTSTAYASKARKMTVTATAYNSVRAQTNSNPSIAAWGDRLKPGMKAIAVSRDLLGKGLKRGTKVKISGLPGEYVVLDKMHHRWRNKIDIYMGKDIRAAKQWGRRKVTLTVL